MEWEVAGPNLFVSGKPVEIRSLRLPDALGRWRRYRVTTVWEPSALRFSRTPAYGRLAKENSGRIGAAVFGKNGGYLRIGSLPGRPLSFFVPLNSLSKKARASILKNYPLTLYNEENFLFAYEEVLKQQSQEEL